MSAPGERATTPARVARVVTFRDRCVGGGLCVLVAPTVFDQSTDGLVELLDPDPRADLADALDEAARVCPGQAIEVDLG